MERNVAIPQVGADIMEVEISSWFVKVGDAVADDTVVAELLADKASIELTAGCAGIVLKILKPEGAVASVGETVLVIQCQG